MTQQATAAAPAQAAMALPIAQQSHLTQNAAPMSEVDLGTPAGLALSELEALDIFFSASKASEPRPGAFPGKKVSQKRDSALTRKLWGFFFSYRGPYRPEPVLAAHPKSHLPPPAIPRSSAQAGKPQASCLAPFLPVRYPAHIHRARPNRRLASPSTTH